MRKAFMKEKVGAGLRPNPSSYCRELERMMPSGFLKPGYKVVKYYGGGGTGQVFQVCKNDYECFAVKARRSDDKSDWKTAKDEYQMQNQVAKLGLAPRINKMYIPKQPNKLAFALMEPIDGTLYSFLRDPKSKTVLNLLLQSVLLLLRTLHKNKYVHGDFHWDNIAYFVDNKMRWRLQLIDFGMTNKGNQTFVRKFAAFDVSQLIRTLGRDLTPKMNNNNRKYLDSILKQYYRQHFNSKVKNFGRESDSLWKKYEDTFM